MKRMVPFILLATILLTACQQEKKEITISAAASLTDAINEAVALFEEENPEYDVAVNLGGSGSLSKQIIQGAPVDVFFSASVDHLLEVKEAGLMDDESIQALLQNKLVWVQPKDTATITDVKAVNHIAIGTPETVPAGMYAKQALDDLGIYQGLKEQLVFTKDVRQVMQYVESENAELGVVYRTEALVSDKVQINSQLPLGKHDPIIYPVGMLHNANKEANPFYQFLQSEEVMDIFNKYGFEEVDGDVDDSIFSTN
ncbi:molybdate ABC transporter substrate-binding protein [Gracilibacillus caseinilyticus]|uniref:Molybdate ABC transporter substrate-binding protein n=1 Tax=Gracilibacillus caseinilyticus TaxID=2932256 RepID=A0ABY4EXG6_9BACI|nr:molybdate ABC transporter substrate-binding protein [Gracilibacillus caseinilyticus]UOQ48975.1 molybdate ABC transporter substrate-binding protein [Gracilibacillus caseinilyticus]